LKWPTEYCLTLGCCRHVIQEIFPQVIILSKIFFIFLQCMISSAETSQIKIVTNLLETRRAKFVWSLWWNTLWIFADSFSKIFDLFLRWDSSNCFAKTSAISFHFKSSWLGRCQKKIFAFSLCWMSKLDKSWVEYLTDWLKTLLLSHDWKKTLLPNEIFSSRAQSFSSICWVHSRSFGHYLDFLKMLLQPGV